MPDAGPGLALPLIQQQTTYPAPLESAPASTTEGLASSAEAALMSTLGASLETKGVGAALEAGALGPQGSLRVPHDKAVAMMKQQNYDPGVLPSGDISAGQLTAIMNQQGIIARSREIAQRSGAPGIAKDVASFAGGLGDPLFLAGGPALGKVLGAAEPLVGASRAGRAAFGATEAGSGMAAYVKGQQEFGTSQGDRDITMYQGASQVTFAALLGGGFGALSKSPVTAQDISSLERSAAAAKVQGVPISEVTSPKGAVGEFQIMPSTAAAYGIPAEALKDPATNRHIADMLLTELNKKYPADPEAVAIAYNAGPKVANKWLIEGRDDSVLPAETRDYVSRFRQERGIPANAPPHEQVPLPPAAMQEAGKTAVTQFIADAPIDVKPTVEKALDDPHGLASESALGEDEGFKSAVTGEHGMFDVPPYRTNAFKVEQEGSDDIAHIYSDAAAAHGQQRSAQAEIDKQFGFGEAEKPKGPEQTMADEAEKQAQAFGPRVTGQADPQFEALKAQLDEEDAKHSEGLKGLEAAVKCGVIRGFEE